MCNAAFAGSLWFAAHLAEGQSHMCFAKQEGGSVLALRVAVGSQIGVRAIPRQPLPGEEVVCTVHKPVKKALRAQPPTSINPATVSAATHTVAMQPPPSLVHPPS